MADLVQPLPTNPDKDSVKVVLELALHEEQGLADRANWLDTKTGAILGFVIVSVAELLGFLFLASAEHEKLATRHPCGLIALFLFGVAALIVGMILGFYELIPMGFQYGASTEYLALHVNEGPETLRLRCIDSLRQTSVVNRAIVNKKAKLAKWTAFCVGVALVSYAITAVILFLSVI